MKPMRAKKFIRLHLISGDKVDINLSEWSRGGGGTPNFGDPDHVIDQSMRRGFFAISRRDNEAAGLNGGVGDVQYPVTSIIKTEILEHGNEASDFIHSGGIHISD
jgi:hypothetical protein